MHTQMHTNMDTCVGTGWHLQRRLILVVVQQLQVRQHVAHLRPVKQTLCAHKHVRNSGGDQRLLHVLGLRVGTVHDRHVGVAAYFAAMHQPLDFRGHEFGLVCRVPGSEYPDLLAGLANAASDARFAGSVGGVCKVRFDERLSAWIRCCCAKMRHDRHTQTDRQTDRQKERRRHRQKTDRKTHRKTKNASK